MFRHRSAVAEVLQGSLLPASLPEVPGLDLSAVYVPASEGLEVSGDFYDVFPVQGGWAITVGDVCGKGQEATTRTASSPPSSPTCGGTAITCGWNWRAPVTRARQWYIRTTG
ncbi:MAG: PP2C family protein-serine/threonine phosphatase, partial [Streptosporangiaceae bacterium]